MQLPPRGAGANAAAASSDSSLSMQSDDDDGLDMDGAAMFNRHSVAIFERLNKEQVRLFWFLIFIPFYFIQFKLCYYFHTIERSRDQGNGKCFSG